MNVALIIERLDGGGAEAVVASLARQLALRGDVRPFVHCLRSAGPRGDALRRAGIAVREYRSGARDLRLPLRIAARFLREGIDLANTHSSAAFVRGLPACAALRIPIVRTLHGELLGRPTRDRRIADRLAGWAAATTAVADAALPRRMPPRSLTRVIRNGVSLPAPDRAAALALLAQRIGAPPAGPLVLSIGAICPEKDALTLVSAFARLRGEVPAARLVHAGAVRDARHAEQAAALARELGCAEAIHWLGPLPDAWRLLAAADVFCLSSRREATPLVVLEAMSQRCPIVATRAGDVPRTLRDGVDARLVAPQDADALAAALSAALRDPAGSRALAERAHARFDRAYSAERMAAEYAETFFEVRRRRRSAPRTPAARRRRAARAHRQPVLMVGPAAPAVGGMVTAADTIAAGPLNVRWRCERFAATREGSRRESTGALRLAGALRRHAGNAARLIAACLLRRPRIAHLHTCSGFSFVRSVIDAAIARSLGVRVVFHVHGGRFAEYARSPRGFGRLALRAADALAGAFVVVEPHAQAALESRCRTPVYCVPNAVRTRAARRPRASAGGPCRFLFLGALTEAKGIDDLLSAARALFAGNVPLTLTAAGPDPDGRRDARGARIAADALADRVSLRAAAPPAERDDLLDAADCLVLPSYSEAMPMCVLEAAAAGLAVVATRVGRLPALAEEFDRTHGVEGYSFAASLVEPGDVRGLAAAMRRLAEDPALRHQLGRALREFVSVRYGLEQQAERIDAMYRQVLGRSIASAAPREVAHAQTPRAVEPPALVECV